MFHLQTTSFSPLFSSRGKRPRVPGANWNEADDARACLTWSLKSPLTRAPSYRRRFTARRAVVVLPGLRLPSERKALTGRFIKPPATGSRAYGRVDLLPRRAKSKVHRG